MLSLSRTADTLHRTAMRNMFFFFHTDRALRETDRTFVSTLKASLRMHGV